MIAKCLESTVKRSGDLISRYGGEEFLVVLAETKPENALSIAQSLQDAVNRLQLPHSGSLISDHVTLSIGVASAIPDTEVSHEVLVKQADIALYQAKEEGRNRIVCVSELVSKQAIRDAGKNKSSCESGGPRR